jgi:hypothetical protein
MWHWIRRKWATEPKGYPVKDVAAAGGWKTEEVVVMSYQQVDAANDQDCGPPDASDREPVESGDILKREVFR